MSGTGYGTAKSRKNHAGTPPITRASGAKRVVLACYDYDQRLADATYLTAFDALSGSPGARGFYEIRGAAGHTHRAALPAPGNRLGGVLHGRLEHTRPTTRRSHRPTVPKTTQDRLTFTHVSRAC
jgi:hypothetical protein